MADKPIEPIMPEFAKDIKKRVEEIDKQITGAEEVLKTLEEADIHLPKLKAQLEWSKKMRDVLLKLAKQQGA